MMIFPIEHRNQSRGVLLSAGRLYGVAASKAFDQPPMDSNEIEPHAQVAFERMEEVLNEAGLSRENVKFVQIYLHDVLNDIDGFNKVWRNYFASLAPARCCVGATLQSGMLVEMTFIAESN